MKILHKRGNGLKRKIELIESKKILLDNKARNGTPYIVRVYRGGVFYADLGNANVGGEKNKARPVLVISPNMLNKGDTIIVVPLSTKFQRKYPGGPPRYNNHFLLKKSDYPFLDKDSVAKFEDIRSIDVARLRNLLGNIESSDMNRAKDKLLYATGY